MRCCDVGARPPSTPTLVWRTAGARPPQPPNSGGVDRCTPEPQVWGELGRSPQSCPLSSPCRGGSAGSSTARRTTTEIKLSLPWQGEGWGGVAAPPPILARARIHERAALSRMATPSVASRARPSACPARRAGSERRPAALSDCVERQQRRLDAQPFEVEGVAVRRRCRHACT